MARKFFHPDLSEIDLATVLNALGDPVRLQIVQSLIKQGTTSCSHSCSFPLAKSTLSNHYRILREAGVVSSRKEGVSHLNTLRREELNKRFPGLLDNVLKSYQKESSQK